MIQQVVEDLVSTIVPMDRMRVSNLMINVKLEVNLMLQVPLITWVLEKCKLQLSLL